MSKTSSSFLAGLVLSAGLSGGFALADPIGVLDTPTAGQTVSGVVPVAGWVLSHAGVDKVELWLDGAVHSRAVTNIPRPDVIAMFPEYADSPTSNPGFFTSFSARGLPAGPHLVSIMVTETGNSQVFDLATVSVTITAAGANQAPFGNLETPSDSQALSGSVAVTGWVVDDSGRIDHIDFLVDGKVVAGAPSSAIYGLSRPDVFAVYPDVPNSLNSGFVANIDTTAFVDGVHVISVRAFDRDGSSSVIGARVVEILNSGSILPPFGFLDAPLDDSSVLCETEIPVVDSDTCPQPCFPTEIEGLSVPASFYKNVVAGWALDVGAREDPGQVSYVELLVDGEIILNTSRDCVQTGKLLANCYGINRPDVAHAYPGYVNADNSGFQFLFALVPDPDHGVLDIVVPGVFGFPTVAGFTTPGKHTIAVRAGDEKETVTQFGAISVDVLCDIGPFSDRPALGYIDFPAPLQLVNGVANFSGWAFDYDNGGADPWVNGITRLDIDIDGQVVASLLPPYFGRADVPANDFRIPATPNTVGPVAFVGWAVGVDTTKLSDSQHDLVVYAWDTPDASTGRPSFRSEVGRRKFVVFNRPK